MKVLHIISSSGMYGAEAMLFNLMLAQRNQGWEPVLAAIPTSGDGHLALAGRLRAAGLPVEVLPSGARFSVAAARYLQRICLSQSVSLLHAHGYKADLYASLTRGRLHLPFLATCHNWTRATMAVRVYEALDICVLRTADHVVGVSETVVETLHHRAGIPMPQLSVIDNGVSLPPAGSRSTALRERLRAGTGPLIGFAGRLEREKGTGYFLRAAREILNQCPDARFVLCGEGSLEQEVRAEMASLGIAQQVTLLGYCEDMKSFYDALDVFVLSSVNEGMPMVLLEAMAHGVPVVATDVGAVRRMVQQDVTGTVVTPKDAGAIATAVTRYLDRPELAMQHAKQGAALIASEYSADAMARRYLTLYSSLLASHGLAVHPATLGECR